MARVIINRISIQNKLSKSLTQRRFQGLAYNAANTRFIAAKSNALSDFQEHEVTKEILAGPKADSIFLAKGNLVSFLGLENGESVIADIRNKLEIGMRMNKTPSFFKTKDGVAYEFSVKAPSFQEIYDSAPSPWSSKSWVEQVQDGVSNFLYFIYSKTGRFAKYSRSGTGLQNKKGKSGRSSKVLGIKYINEIIQNFRNKFR